MYPLFPVEEVSRLLGRIRIKSLTTLERLFTSEMQRLQLKRVWKSLVMALIPLEQPLRPIQGVLLLDLLLPIKAQRGELRFRQLVMLGLGRIMQLMQL